MIDEGRIKEAQAAVSMYIAERKLITGDTTVSKFVDFFLGNAETSLQTADLISRISESDKLKASLNMENKFESYLWAIVTSYYSMFYTALALLAKRSIRVGKESAHKIVADALINFFIPNKKLAELLEAYETSRSEAMDLLGKERFESKAKDLVDNFERERRKRGKFQYEIGVQAKQAYARTSLDRARIFLFEIRKVIAKM